MIGPRFQNSDVEQTFQSYRTAARERLLALRAVIYDVAASISECGAVVESLKWGQPSYATINPKSGSPIRIDQTEDGYALYCHCQTGLIDQWRQLYRDDLCFEGNRAIRFSGDAPFPEAPVRHCVALALTYYVQGEKHFVGLEAKPPLHSL